MLIALSVPEAFSKRQNAWIFYLLDFTNDQKIEEEEEIQVYFHNQEAFP